MESVIEKDCSALGGLFQTLIGDMKSGYPIWEDFITKAGKLQSQFRATVVALAAFLDAFQKVADLATNSRGGTRDIGSGLTRMCMRHRSIEAKFKQFSMTFLEALINPLQEQTEEWKRGVYTLDKDHAREYKRARQEIKKKSSDTLKLQKKAKKADTVGRGDILPQLDCAMQDVNDKYILLEEIEKEALRKALIEERQRFCTFVALLRPVVDEEISMLGEVTHLQAISNDLKSLTSDPHKLPAASEQVILDLKGSDYSWSYQSPPSSPSTTTSRKSSMCSSTLSQQAPARLSSISSHDSGFISSSHDQCTSSKSSSPMPANSKDWAKPGPYDQPMINTLRKKKDKGPPVIMDNNGVAGRESSTPQSLATATLAPAEMPQKVSREERNRTTPAKAGDLETHDELALALSRGLELDTQRSNRDSIQCSSGYNTQTNTPSCSEDTIPSQVSDFDYFSMTEEQDPEQQQSDFDKSSTIPRNSDIGQSCRRMFQTKRPASTAGMPSTHAPYPVQGGYHNGACPSTPTHKYSSSVPYSPTPTGCSNQVIFSGYHNVSGSHSTSHGPVIVTPGVATIRRTPSSKPSARRSGSVVSTGPIPIRTPVVPVKIPTVPDKSGVLNGSKIGEEIGKIPDSPTFPQGDNGGVPPVVSWSGQASSNPPTVPLPNQLAQQHPHSERGETETGDEADGNMLVAIRNGVKLKRTLTNDRSAPRIA
ncbi:protein MTSS 1-like isoform X9 [Hippocampus zosterae]|uniref:protein MTSS 1-like isoform X9 n=1 Tax=Hippocampus zosterae TaxID=109293 RepID=UPI00223CA72A|nr:protein MTSS 1-like isoform X9 [Hippocampus zosterae]